ncbi:hypothetical protein DVU_1800 [Nitratidesulfovibrio vulgaris str. Hildenborough]|uniref:Uncharacterized protein n=1 Tax=Nitratidesulfovibrio vulgaris (strain ATCC 29579 / DSM 644 / CCUG 34227 / NCIMB 8303 / VKM B-1760 / Hildenborough) TaxID=882 RepID=Q72B38_NITV2|nr:hypothetical protein DVU_1800 [Nitratidesulfovibrio vulgaris str. Hildenborough]
MKGRYAGLECRAIPIGRGIIGAGEILIRYLKD